jgi:hypothetical protein
VAYNDDDEYEEFAKLTAQTSRALMGYVDTLHGLPGAIKPELASVRRVGGGVIVEPRQPTGIAELHILPHAGTELPRGYLSDPGTSRASSDELASLVVANCDSGTPSMAHALAADAGHIEDRATYVAYFEISRLFLDANRLVSTDQIPARPYIGPAEPFYKPYLEHNGHDLRVSLLLPWIDEVNDLIKRADIQIVYHHHTYDEISRGIYPNDREPNTHRPPAQTFLVKPSVSTRPDLEGEMAPKGVVNLVRDQISAWLTCIGIHDRRVPIDDPLVVPALPYFGCTIEGPGDTYAGWHILYELRKDMLLGATRRDLWIDCLSDLRAQVAHHYRLFSRERGTVV